MMYLNEIYRRKQREYLNSGYNLVKTYNFLMHCEYHHMNRRNHLSQRVIKQARVVVVRGTT